MLEAHTGLGCPGSSICPWITNLGKGQVHNTHTTHTEHNTTHSHTMYKTHTPQHNVQNIYSGQSACTGCSAVVSPLALAHTAPNPPESPTCLEWSTKHKRESNGGKKSILSLRSPFQLLPTSQQRPWQESGLALGHQPNPVGSQGKPWCCSGNALPLPQKEKTPQKKKHFTFPLGKSFCSISLVAWKSLAGSEGERR